jgi:putative ABC transport system permease protein
MERFGLNLGDELTFNIAGAPLSGRITSIREVDWDSFKVNFFVIGPPALLEGQPQTYITSIHLPDALDGEKNRWLREFPAVTAIDVAALLAQVRAVIGQATRAVEYVFLFTLFAGLTVLYAAVQATRDVRRHETALLRTLGARRHQIRNGLLAEFGTLGLLSGLLAAVIASAVGGLLAWQVFGFDYSINPMTFVFGVAGGTLGIGLAGWLGTRRVLDLPPLRVLRGPE